MNKKNKNKNRSKPPNPVPPSTNVEPSPIIEEGKIVLAEEKSLSLVTESAGAIEATSEINDSVQETDQPTDTPKKPKRNKGKKKKQDDTSSDENKLTSIQDIAVPLFTSETEPKISSETLIGAKENKIEEGDKNIEENVAANVRKKKNKKKPNNQLELEELPQDVGVVEKPEEALIKEENVTDKTTKPEVITPDVIESNNKQSIESDNKQSIESDNKQSIEPDNKQSIESDNKQSKKKSKKKKHRLDSEKSDKADDTVICTAAFQKLISSSDNEGDINPDTTIESPKDSGEGEKNLSTLDKEETLKDLIVSVLLPEQSKEDETSQQDRTTESKSKKKTKKDKKQPQPKKDNEKNSIPGEQIIEQEPSEVSKIDQESPSLELVECELKETIPKAKAKIAKPVEKKRKGKTESIEDSENNLKENVIIVGLDIKEPLLNIEKIEENVCESIISHDENVQNTDNLPKIEQANKDEQNIVISDETLSSNIINPSITKPTITTDSNLLEVNIGIKSNEEIAECSLITPDPVLLKLDTELDKHTIAEVNKEVAQVPAELYKTVEKKKKKHPKKIETSGEKIPENKVLVTPESESTREKTPQKLKEDVVSSVSTPGEVEISSLKTDELDGASDATPDLIQHPLATSQQLIDGNNNMIIREITSTDEKLNLNLIISTEPIIQDSGETPDPTAEKISIEDPSFIAARQRSVEPEKTDLKSKMMEVSQDMEELRLSIERSLAELTSMEKSEPDIVKGSEQIEVSKLVTTTEQKPIAIKDDLLEQNKTLCENIVGEKIVQETDSISKHSTEIIDTETQKCELLHKTENIQDDNINIPAPVISEEQKDVSVNIKENPPQAPARKDHKGKGKGKRKGKQEVQTQQPSTAPETTTVAASESTSKEVKKEEKSQEQQSQSSESNKDKGKQQQSMQLENDCNESDQASSDSISNIIELSFEPIENFEDALTSSVDDVNKTFELIANEVNKTPEIVLQNPQINVTSPTEDAERVEPKQSPVSPPKNLLGQPDIPVQSNRTDYKKEKNKPPNMRQATVKIKDAVDIDKSEKTKQSKESQTENKRKAENNKNVLESFSYMTNENAEYIYKYSFRKVFLQSLCHVCRKELVQRLPCQFCSLVFYCGQKHKDEDWPQHQSLCFAICTIAHLKDQKHIYADAKNITGQSYRLLRMQMIISCEKVLKRKLVPWEQEALLYPRFCADVACREWRQSKLADCEGCGQISYCLEQPSHLPASHQRWCKSYALYQKLVHHQQTRGRLEPKLPTRIVCEGYMIPEKINEVLAAMYDEKIDMTDMDYAALTQLATAPLTTAYCHQIATANNSNGISKKSSLVVHVVGAELQVEADVLFKWELFFLHLQPHVKELRVVLISPELNPNNLPLNLLEKINLCDSCKEQKRRIHFSFQDKKTYYEYWGSEEFFTPDIVCTFNPSIQRSSMYNSKDTWPTTISCILKLKTPLIVSSHSIEELKRDVARIKECSELSGIGFKSICDPKCNPFASVRPDRNFITDDEIPLLFKNYCFVVLCGV